MSSGRLLLLSLSLALMGLWLGPITENVDAGSFSHLLQGNDTDEAFRLLMDMRVPPTGGCEG